MLLRVAMGHPPVLLMDEDGDMLMDEDGDGDMLMDDDGDVPFPVWDEDGFMFMFMPPPPRGMLWWTATHQVHTSRCTGPLT